MIPAPSETFAEELLANFVEWVRLLVEAAGAGIIAFGMVSAIVSLLQKRRMGDFNAIRLKMATYLVLALEFQLAADILSTAVAPTWDKIGKLGAIAVIRTGLSFFLMREIEIEKKATGEHPVEKG